MLLLPGIPANPWPFYFLGPAAGGEGTAFSISLHLAVWKTGYYCYHNYCCCYYYYFEGKAKHLAHEGVCSGLQVAMSLKYEIQKLCSFLNYREIFLSEKKNVFLHLPYSLSSLSEAYVPSEDG